MKWIKKKFEELRPETNPFFEDLRKTYGEDWERWIKKTAQDSVWILVEKEDSDFFWGFIKLKFGPIEKGVKICSFKILRELRRKGYGSRVFRELERWIKEKGYKRVYGSIESSKTSVLRWFEGKGFRRIEEREKEIGNDRIINEIIIEKTL